METRVSRRDCLKRTVVAGAAAACAGLAPGRTDAAEASHPTVKDTFGLLRQGKKIPIVFDTDIGGDIDDTWALVMLLRCPELDVKLVISDAGNATYRARILAKMLDVAGRTDIPVAVGVPPGDDRGPQSRWTEGYDLAQYPGTVHEDGVEAIIRTVKESPTPVTIVCIGGVPNIAEALQRDPNIVKNARFVGMHGSIRRGYRDGSRPAPEANVVRDPKALQAVFAAPWECTITPLDTCGRVELHGRKYERVFRSQDVVVRALIENYRIWTAATARPHWRPDPTKRSTTLFDTVAVYLAFSEELLEMEDLPLRVTDEGMTVVDRSKRAVRCAMGWRDLGAFEDLLVQRVIGPG